MRQARALSISLLAGFLAACGGIGEGPGGGGISPGDLEGRNFLSRSVLKDGVELPLVPGTQILLGFDDGRISVHAGCNSMGGEYMIDDATLRLSGPLSMTEMGCDPERHDQDEWVSALVGDGPRIALAGDTLTLSGSDVVLELLDREVADPDRPLIGTRWRLESIVEGEVVSSVPVGLAATIEFGQDGTVELGTGCNEGTGTVQVAQGTVTFRALSLTERSCGADVAALERRLLEVLRGEVSYTIDGPRLSISAGDLGLDWLA